jgi:Stress responsive A/B Barrel Domain
VSVLHLVSFRYKAEVDEAQRNDHRTRLESLHDLDGITSLKVGADIVRSPRSFDTGLAVTFVDRAALDAYQKNPRHVPIAQFGVSLTEQIVAVDFEI